MYVENLKTLNNYEEAEFWALKIGKSQMEDNYFSELHLQDIYQRTGNIKKYREIYDSLMMKSEASLSKDLNTYNMLHSMSINLQDYGMTEYFFEKYLEYHGESASVLANHVIYYMNNGLVAAAIPLMRRSLELDPKLSLANQFKQIMAQNPNL